MRTRLFAVILGALCALAGCRPPDGESGPKTDDFGDNQVVGLAVVLTDHQVQVALAVLARGPVRVEVSAFATRVVEDLTPARDRFIDLAEEQRLVIDETTVEAKSHLQDTKEDIQLIQPPVEGIQVDQVYLADALHDLDKAIEVWDNTQLPSVRNAALKEQLIVTRQIFVDVHNAGLLASQATGIAEKRDD
jgi:hypothetical protein